jgi:glutamate/tyrosine decarboxylase-like PLP-dependent enzyme
VVPVDEKSRELSAESLRSKITGAYEKGIRYFIVNINLSTTMFGSVDDIDMVTGILEEMGADFKLHIDGAFGGFIFPFTNPSDNYNFRNPHVSSITIDGHKMLQAPYGTGIFLVRKNMMHYVCTEEASYIRGKDYTLCGSRSGANAACVWMILNMHGSTGWSVKMNQLLDKTTTLCAALDELAIEYYRNPYLNIIAIRARHISPELAAKFLLVPDNHDNPKWYKIVMMSHVKQGTLDQFISNLSASKLIHHE